MFGGANQGFGIFNNMRVGSPDREGGTVADRLPARSLLVPGKIVVENSRLPSSGNSRQSPPEYVPARVLEVTHLELCLGCIAERQSSRSGASHRIEE